MADEKTLEFLTSLVELRRLDLSIEGISPTSEKKSARNYLAKPTLEELRREYFDLIDRTPENFYSVEGKEDQLDISVWDMNLSIRARKVLSLLGVDYVGQLVQRRESDFTAINNCGQETLKHIKQKLYERGLNLNMNIDYVPPNEGN